MILATMLKVKTSYSGEVRSYMEAHRKSVIVYSTAKDGTVGLGVSRTPVETLLMCRQR